jgi:15-cis-phytoene synthase
MPQPELSATRSLVWLYSSIPQRLALTSLSAIEREIGASARAGLDHAVAHTRLDWWREECDRTAQGRPSHPLTRELLSVFAPSGAAALAELAGLVANAAWDLSRATFDTREELSAYCERWSAALISPLVRLAGPDVPPAAARGIGVGLQEIELLLALPADARAGRLRVPLDELARADLAPEVLARPPWPEELADLLRARHRELRAALGAALETLAPPSRKALRGLIVWATLACTASRRAEKRLPQASRLRDHHAPLDGWRAWRAARWAEAQLST